MLSNIVRRFRNCLSVPGNFYKTLPLLTSTSSLSVGRQACSSDIFVREPGCSPSALSLLSNDEILLKEAVSKFAKKHIKSLVRKMDEQSMLDKSIIAGLFENGFMGVEVPLEYGGNDAEFFAVVIIVEELAIVDPSVSVFCYVQNTLVSKMVQNFGNELQKQRYLPLLTKNLVGAFCLTEESAGSNAFSLKTTAKLCDDGEHYIINGCKRLITNVEHAGLFIVMANADPDKGYKGITCFLVDREANGVCVGKREDKIGIRASSTCSISFDGVKVQKSAVIGEIGMGYKYAISILNEGRIGIAAQMLGLAQGCFDATVPYLFERKQFGKRLWDFQSVQHQVADLATQIHAARLLIYNAARLHEFNLPHVKEAAMAKLFSSNVATKVTSQCVELLGGVGFSKGPVEKFYRDCKSGTIYAGTSNIQLNTIAKQLEREYHM